MKKNVDADILILGAGAAGLAAASDVQATGKSALILEANDRPGGRIWSPHGTDLGAEFVYDKEGATYKLASELGFTMTSADLENQLYAYHENLLHNPAEVSEKFERLVEIIGEQAEKFEKGTSIEHVLSTDEKLQQLCREFGEEYRHLLRVALESDHCWPLAQVDISEYGDDSSYSSAMYRLDEGYGSFVNALSEHATIEYGQKVRSVRKDGNRVILETEDNQSYRGKGAILTVPLGVLQSGKISFEPGLPAETKKHVKGLNSGAITSLVLTFRKRFWPNDVSSVLTTTPTQVWWPTEKPNTLRAFIGGRDAMNVTKLTDETQVQRALEELSMIFKIRSDIGNLVTDWKVTPWTTMANIRGGYSSVRPGFAGSREKIADGSGNPRVKFSGESYVRDDAAGTVNGAIESGRRAAKEMMSL